MASNTFDLKLVVFKNYLKIRSRDLTTPNLGVICHPLGIVLVKFNVGLFTKYEISVCNHSRDIEEPKFQNGLRDPSHVPLGVIFRSRQKLN